MNNITDFILNENNNQTIFEKPIFENNDFHSQKYLYIPNTLPGFVNTKSEFSNDTEICYLFGFIPSTRPNCPHCNHKMHIKDNQTTTLTHLAFGRTKTRIVADRTRYECPLCGTIHITELPFKDKHHFITDTLKTHVEELLQLNITLKTIAKMTGLHQATIKAIDKERLLNLHVDSATGRLKKPETYSKYIGIDEFKLHNGYKFATHIVDLMTGHILWIQEGKKKNVVYDFIDHVGQEWMSHVVAVACDMNSDYKEAFCDSCPHIKTVFDYFHIVKNFNEKVISAIRKDEHARLIAEGREIEAKDLKKTKYILCSKLETLRKKDLQGEEGQIIKHSSTIFSTTEAVRSKTDRQEIYHKLIQENELLFICDIIKARLEKAYEARNQGIMEMEIDEIISICQESHNRHLIWFGKFLKRHIDGIISHASYSISTGKIEGINNKIKTLRRQGYGYPDDEYFFLKIIDASTHKYTRNPKSPFRG